MAWFSGSMSVPSRKRSYEGRTAAVPPGALTVSPAPVIHRASKPFRAAGRLFDC